MSSWVSKISRKWILLGSLFVWAFWISGLLGNSGLLQCYRLGLVRDRLNARVDVLKREQDRSSSYLARLQQNPSEQEIAIRETLNYSRPSELIFLFSQ